jgi:hypothetical protein
MVSNVSPLTHFHCIGYTLESNPVGINVGYELDGGNSISGESNRSLVHGFKTVVGPTPTSIQWLLGLFLRDVKLTTHL